MTYDGLVRKTAAFMRKPRKGIAKAPVHIVCLARISIMFIIGDNIQPIIHICPGCHIHIATTAAKRDRTLPANSVLIEGMV